MASGTGSTRSRGRRPGFERGAPRPSAHERDPASRAEPDEHDQASAAPIIERVATVRVTSHTASTFRRCTARQPFGVMSSARDELAAGVVHEHVDPAEALERRVDERLDLLGLTDVGRHGQARPAPSSSARTSSSGSGRRPATMTDAPVRASSRTTPSQPGAAARDERDEPGVRVLGQHRPGSVHAHIMHRGGGGGTVPGEGRHGLEPAGRDGARTPSTRDRAVDFLRAASICAVVFGHWFIALIYWERGVVGVRSAVGVQAGMWLGTWFFQVMPVFFFVGGFSNMITLDAFHRRGDSTWAFVREPDLAAVASVARVPRIWFCRRCCTSPTPGRPPGHAVGRHDLAPRDVSARRDAAVRPAVVPRRVSRSSSRSRRRPSGCTGGSACGSRPRRSS